MTSVWPLAPTCRAGIVRFGTVDISVRGAGRETKMASYLDRNNGKPFQSNFRVIVGDIESNEHCAERLLDIIIKLEEVRRTASQLPDEVLIYTVDIAICRVNELLLLDNKRVYSQATGQGGLHRSLWMTGLSASKKPA
jgi:hypothetical protein